MNIFKKTVIIIIITSFPFRLQANAAPLISPRQLATAQIFHDLGIIYCDDYNGSSDTLLKQAIHCFQRAQKLGHPESYLYLQALQNALSANSQRRLAS